MRDLEVRLMCHMVRGKEKVKALFKNERGDTNFIAVVLLLVVVVGLAIIFRKQIGSLFNNIWTAITNKEGEVTDVNLPKTT